jgi:hypothetical protein
MNHYRNNRRDTVTNKILVMKKSFLLHIDKNTVQDIPFEEISFLSSLKANLLEEIIDDIYIIEISLSNPEECEVAALVKIGAYCGEYTGYACGPRWETAVAKAFESIRHQLKLLANLSLPIQENTN